MTLSFSSSHNNEVWKLTIVYGPCDEPTCLDFVRWFRDHDIGDMDNWIFWVISTSIDLLSIAIDLVATCQIHLFLMMPSAI